MNKLATESELYVFSDAPKPGDEEKVKSVRNYLKSVQGFKCVNIIEREENGFVRNYSDGIHMLLDQFGKTIFLEEDIVTASGFIRFVNEALDFYENDDHVFSICGYTPPIEIPKGYKKDVFLSLRFYAWGFGIWKDRYDKIIVDLNEDQFRYLTNDRKKLKRTLSIGRDYFTLIKMVKNGELDALDVKIFFTEIMSSKYNISPTISLVQNIGFDGSGLHCPESSRFDTDLMRSKEKLRLEHLNHPNKSIHRSIRVFYDGGFSDNLRCRLGLLYQSLRRILKLVFNRLTAYV